MAYDYSELVEQTTRWAEQAVAGGWLSPSSAHELCNFETKTPDALFDHPASRPLIVAFMGGTGVGKSSLLNRLAGQVIAKAGIERPTSREVTLFHHRDIAIRHLPEKLPIEKIKIAQHTDDSKKSIVWIDMPDFDSTEQSNKALVFEWLPHIDVLIYVVSPERYRDEKAWRVLLAEGNRHAWLFVLNQWDRGQQAQHEDFRQQLGKAGFAEPIIFKTVCVDPLQPDELSALESTLLSLANTHIVAELEQRSADIRSAALKQKLEAVRESLGSSNGFAEAETIWRQQWQKTASQLTQGFVWPMQKLAAHYANQAGVIVHTDNTGQISSLLWDDWAQTRFADTLDEFSVKVDELGLPVIPLKQALTAIKAQAPKIVHTQSELYLRQALAKPGNALQRGLLTFFRSCEVILPLSAIAWVGYHVFMGYYASTASHDHYLGIDFAVHSSLLILISWLVPWFILKKLKPSLETSAYRGLTKGVAMALSTLENEVKHSIETVSEQQSAQRDRINRIVEHCGQGHKNSLEHLPSHASLKRMLIP